MPELSVAVAYTRQVWLATLSAVSSSVQERSVVLLSRMVLTCGGPTVPPPRVHTVEVVGHPENMGRVGNGGGNDERRELVLELVRDVHDRGQRVGDVLGDRHAPQGEEQEEEEEQAFHIGSFVVSGRSTRARGA